MRVGGVLMVEFGINDRDLVVVHRTARRRTRTRSAEVRGLA